MIRKILKSRAFIFFFLLLFSFIVFLVMILWVMHELNFVDWKMAAEVAAAISFILSMTQFNKNKNRAYKNIENGSSKWGEEKDMKRFTDKNFFDNMILSASIFLSMNMFKTHRNCHVFVVGGSGAGKSRFYVKPNVLQMNASYVITDPSGEHLRDEGKMLTEHGYKVKVFDAVHLKNGMHFNPFVYFREIKDIRRFINILMANTSGDTSNPQYHEDFWVKAERLWMMAIMAYLQETCPEHERNMNSVVLLLNNSEARDDDESFKSAVDVLFDDLEGQNPDSFAAKQYKKFKLAAGKTSKSILISIGVRLADFDIPEISHMFADDELELDKIGSEKTALFIIVDDGDTTYNYLVAMLLDIMFNTLKNVADDQPKHHLDIPVRCMLDEIANIGRFPTLHILVAVLRKRWISLEFLFQNVNQAKAIYKDNWATIEGNCDTTVFLGGKGEDTTKYVSNDLLGKATIDTVSYGSSGNGHSLGASGYSSNEQKAGRNLLDETEVSRLEEDECIVSIRGLNPFHCKKYNPENHPNYRYLADYDPSNTYFYKRGIDLQSKDIQYITLNLQED